MPKPLIGITADNRDNTADSGRYEVGIRYTRAVAEAGGLPLVLPHEPQLASEYVRLCAGIILTGGNDADTTAFGSPVHACAKRIDPRRQAFELAMLDAIDQARRPALGICLGMQLMTLHAGGRINQHLPETLPSAADHQDKREHPIVLRVRDSALGNDGSLMVSSSHHQGMVDPGSLRVVAVSPDGVIEAVDDPARDFYLGVQWHPERGGNDPLNWGLIARFVQAAASAFNKK